MLLHGKFGGIKVIGLVICTMIGKRYLQRHAASVLRLAYLPNWRVAMKSRVDLLSPLECVTCQQQLQWLPKGQAVMNLAVP